MSIERVTEIMNDSAEKCGCGGPKPKFELDRDLMVRFATEIESGRCRITGRWYCLECGNPVESKR